VGFFFFSPGAKGGLPFVEKKEKREGTVFSSGKEGLNSKKGVTSARKGGGGEDFCPRKKGGKKFKKGGTRPFNDHLWEGGEAIFISKVGKEGVRFQITGGKGKKGVFSRGKKTQRKGGLTVLGGGKKRGGGELASHYKRKGKQREKHKLYRGETGEKKKKSFLLPKERKKR